MKKRLLVLAATVSVAVACARVSNELIVGPDSGTEAGAGSGGMTAGGGAGGGAGGAAGAGGVAGTGGAGGAVACKNLQCQQVACQGGASTAVTGTVYAPNGTLPLYNVRVYVPNAPLPPAAAGVTCDQCGGIGGLVPVVASALTDAHGAFRLENVPVGKNIPLVMQVGKWRRQIIIPEVAACQETKLKDADQTRLPRNRKEGDMPHIAVTTGGCDNLSCLLPRLGVDPAEMGAAGDDKAIIYYNGLAPGAAKPTDDVFALGPADMTSASTLWGNLGSLKKYDLLILSCSCDEAMASALPTGTYQAITDYLAMGGRVFGTDFQYTWYRNATDPALAGTMTINPGNQVGQSPVTISTTFPKGRALADWMQFVDAPVTYGQFEAFDVYDHIVATRPTSQVWATSLSDAGATHARIVTTNTPVGRPLEQQCGKAVHLDLHITVGADNNVPRNFPVSCAPTLSKGEEALAFFLFDVSSCVQNESDAPQPPVVIP